MFECNEKDVDFKLIFGKALIMRIFTKKKRILKSHYFKFFKLFMWYSANGSFFRYFKQSRTSNSFDITVQTSSFHYFFIQNIVIG